jgi:hypothetical protein
VAGSRALASLQQGSCGRADKGIKDETTDWAAGQKDNTAHIIPNHASQRQTNRSKNTAQAKTINTFDHTQKIIDSMHLESVQTP